MQKTSDKTLTEGKTYYTKSGQIIQQLQNLLLKILETIMKFQDMEILSMLLMFSEKEHLTMKT